MNAWSTNPFELRTLSELEALLPFLGPPPFEADLWDVQNAYYDLMKLIMELKPEESSEVWLQLFRSVGDNLGIAVPPIFAAPGEEKFAVPIPQASELQISASADRV
jgi:hypothetical protein